MRITHLCLACFFPDGYSYQENILPKYHKKAGHDVTVIASLQTFDETGRVSYLEKASTYTNENDLLVVRLDYKKPEKVYKKFKRFEGLYSALEKANPDLIFIHGCQFLDIDVVISYLKKHKDVQVYVDNHADFSNSATNWLSKNVLHKLVWKRCAQMINPYTKRFYGVLPARVDFLHNIYGIDKDKIELLVMGVDDEFINKPDTDVKRKQFREQYGIQEDDFLLVTGGKIDPWKQQTLLLMDAVNNMNNPKVKLLVFGSVDNSLKEAFDNKCTDKVQYLGWKKPEESYDCFGAADLAVFPGRHSVFWEQVAGQGIPMLVKHWDGTTHVDLGGNVKFLYNDSVDEIAQAITQILDEDVYCTMKETAKRVQSHFLYSNIAARSIEEK